MNINEKETEQMSYEAEVADAFEAKAEVEAEAASDRTDGKKKKKLSIFARALLIYTGVLLIISAALLGVCWEALSQYEDSQPKHVMEDVCEDFTPYLKDALAEKYKSSISEYETWESVFEKVLAPAFAGEYTFKKAVKEYTAQNPVFTVSCESDIANITLARSSETSSFGFASWEVSRVDIIADLTGVATISSVIEVPTGVEITVNGKPLTEDAQKTQSYPFPSQYEKNAALPEYSVYTVEGLYSEPKISVTADGTALTEKLTDGRHVFDYPESMRHTLTVTVPYDSIVKVGGVELSESDIGEGSIRYESALKYDNAHYLKYSISGLISEPSVEVFDKTGKKREGLSEQTAHSYTLEYKESDSHTLKVIFPSTDTALSINGTDATGEIVSDKQIPAYSYTDGIEKYVKGHIALGYVELAGIYGEPSVKCTDKKTGNELTAVIVKSDGEVFYTFSPAADPSLKAEYEKYAIAYTDDYIGYCSGGYQIVDQTFSVAAAHLEWGSPAYKKLYSTKFSFGKNKPYTVTNKQITTYDYISLGDNAFSCLVDFEMDITTSYDVEQKTQHDKVVGMRLTYAKIGNTWKIVGLSM